MTLSEVQKKIKDFTEKRNWKNDDPSHLITSLVIEVAELSELFQWKNTFGDYIDKDKKKQIAFEIVDVINYLFQIANKSGIDDLAPYYIEKMQKAEDKFPIGASKEEHTRIKEEYRKTGKNKLY